jgi:hypothetical protein
MIVTGGRCGGGGWKLSLDWALADVAVASASSPTKAVREIAMAAIARWFEIIGILQLANAGQGAACSAFATGL